MNGFFIYLAHVVFEGFKCSWFTNFYTRLLLDKPSFDEDGEEIEENAAVIKVGIKRLYIFELVLIWFLIFGLFYYYYKITLAFLARPIGPKPEDWDPDHQEKAKAAAKDKLELEAAKAMYAKKRAA